MSSYPADLSMFFTPPPPNRPLPNLGLPNF
nr:MAG TPA: hypothetical protein [Caudoviricetes sp.]